MVTDIDASKNILIRKVLCSPMFHCFVILKIEKAAGVVEEIKAAGGRAISVPGDVTDPGFPAKLIGETIKYVTTTPRRKYDDVISGVEDKDQDKELRNPNWGFLRHRGLMWEKS